MKINPLLPLAALLAAAPSRTPASAQETQTSGPAAVRLVVNIPAGRLQVYENGRVSRSYPVSVGTRGHQTPAGSYRIGRVVLNPWWHPPAAAWARKKKVTPPGPGNPMGRAKIHLSRDYYIHGTPAANEGRLGSPASHGCIRMRNADVMELARLIQRHDPQGLPAAEVARLAASPRQTREVSLAGRVTAEIVYDLVEVKSGKLRVHPDVYGMARGELEKQVRTALARSGVQPGELNPDVLGLVLSASRSGTREIPLQALTARPRLKVDPSPSLSTGARLAGLPSPSPGAEGGLQGVAAAGTQQ
jgi:hypothetical protein